jgi:hypothetical protein
MKALQILVAYLGTALFQVGWHWFLSCDNSLARALLRFYLAYNAKLGKGVAPVLDILLPSVCLGAIVGFLSWNWHPRKVVGLVIAASIGLVVLLPVYAHFLTKDENSWWPKENQDLLLFLFGRLAQAVLVVGMLVYAGRQVGLYHNQPKDG